MSMLGILENLKPLLKVRNVAEKAAIDNKVFRLHYRITSLILLGCCAFVTAYSIFGNPIECEGAYDKEKRKVVNTYCYLGYTYTLPHIQNSDGKMAGIGPGNKFSAKKYHNYYRWIPVILFLQGILFYVPYWIWKCYEGKKLNHLTDGFRGPVVKVKLEHRARIRNLAKYAADSLHTHNHFALMYYFCELLNFLNVIANMYMMNVFLNGEFMKYGLEVLSFTDMNQESRTDPMIEVFPRVTKCDFHKIGPSGSIVNLDFLCILSLNNVNEKIYIFLWFWFIVLACLSVVPFVYNIGVFLSPTFRRRELKQHCVLNGKSRVRELVEKTQIGDFFLWELLGRNMSSKCFSIFIKEVYESIIMKKTSYGFDPKEEFTNEKPIESDLELTVKFRKEPHGSSLNVEVIPNEDETQSYF